MVSPFPMPVLFTAWEWHNGAGIAGKVIAAARRGGFGTVAVQLREDTGGDPSSTLDAQDVQYLKDAGLFVVGWDVAGPDHAQKCAELGLQGWLPQVESSTQLDALLSVLKSGAPALPRALVTTYGGLTTAADVKALVEAWGGMPFTFVECYKDTLGHPYDQIDRMLWQGTQYGFDAGALRALVGTYRGEFPTDYEGLTSANYGGIYLEESTSAEQLYAFGPLAQAPTPKPTPEPTVTNDAPERNAQIAKIAEEWLAHFGPAPLTRLALIDRIAKITDADWNAARQYVKEALDGTAAKKDAALVAAQAKIAAAKSALG